MQIDSLQLQLIAQKGLIHERPKRGSFKNQYVYVPLTMCIMLNFQFMWIQNQMTYVKYFARNDETNIQPLSVLSILLLFVSNEALSI